MVRGIATDSKRYKHIKRSDEKWFCDDLLVFKRTVEKYINNIRPDDKEENGKTIEKNKKKMMTIDRIFAILFLGFFGSITLITGIYFLLQGKSVIVGFPILLFGFVAVISFILYERYR